jgi:hypothetical protein
LGGGNGDPLPLPSASLKQMDNDSTYTAQWFNDVFVDKLG